MSRATAILIFTAGCGSESIISERGIVPSDPELAITGRACHPVTQTWIPDALVYTHLYDDNDIVYDSRSDNTDEAGAYTLPDLVPYRDYEVYVQLGRDVVDKFIVGVEGLSVEIPAGSCAPDTDLDVAVVSGSYDDLAPLVASIGANVRTIDGQVGSELLDFLLDPAEMAEHDAIVFDGGHSEDGLFYGAGPVAAVHDNLRAFVRGGGVVYATDWSYDVVAQIWPGKLDFYGDDALPDAAQVGDDAFVVGNVVDVDLADTLGTITLDLQYDISGWPIVEAADPSTTVHVRGEAPYRVGLTSGTVADAPLLASFSDDAGQVWLSTFRATVNDEVQMATLLRYALVSGG